MSDKPERCSKVLPTGEACHLSRAAHSKTRTGGYLVGHAFERVPSAPMRVIVVPDGCYSEVIDGSEPDVTEGVKVLYDHVVGSMDWGSGFLDDEEAAHIVQIALACGFIQPEEARQTFDEFLHYETHRCGSCDGYIRWLHTGWAHVTGRFGWESKPANHSPQPPALAAPTKASDS